MRLLHLIVVDVLITIASVGYTIGDDSKPTDFVTDKMKGSKALSEDDIKAIIEADLAKDGKTDYAKARKLEKESQTAYNGAYRIILRRECKRLEILTPPYVIWDCNYYTYNYKINGITGEILIKRNTIEY